MCALKCMGEGEQCMAEIPPVRRVAVALFDGFTVLDVYGPVQAFASCRIPREDGTLQRLFEIFSMAEQSGVVKAGEGPASYAEYSFANAPAFDILLIPGGFGTRVAPQLTVVWFACNENGGPGILPLGTFPNATRRTQAWTPQQHSAPMWHAPPEDKPARVTLASTRARTSAFSAQRVRRRSAPRKARPSIACGPRRRR